MEKYEQWICKSLFQICRSKYAVQSEGSNHSDQNMHQSEGSNHFEIMVLEF